MAAPAIKQQFSDVKAGAPVQVKNPVTGRWVKLDTNTGRILDTKKSPGPYKSVPTK